MTDVTIGTQIQLLGREVDTIQENLNLCKDWTREVREALGLEETESALARIKLLVKNTTYREHSVETIVAKMNEREHYQYDHKDDLDMLKQSVDDVLWAISELNA